MNTNQLANYIKETHKKISGHNWDEMNKQNKEKALEAIFESFKTAGMEISSSIKWILNIKLV